MSAKITTLAAMQRSREIVAVSPFGHTYKLRPLNMERYALAGELPAALRKIAMQGADGVDAVLAGDEDVLGEHGAELRDYLDRLVRQVLVEPVLTEDDDMDMLPPVDYRWLVQVAMGETDRDGEGRRLWGREPLSVWGTFRDEHGCGEDCAACDRLQRPVAEIQ